LTSLFEASQIAVQAGVHAMTDVTGFGVAGHLREMLVERRLSVNWTEQILTFQDVDACIAQGIQSSAHADNVRYAQQIAYNAPNPVLFDPQTCGPLMIAAPPEIARKVVQLWKQAGLSPQQIGVVTTETS
jgi:selenide,water dikinase